MKMLMFHLYIIFIHHLFVADAAGQQNGEKFSKREKSGNPGAARLSLGSGALRPRITSTTTNDPNHSYGVAIISTNKSSSEEQQKYSHDDGQMEQINSKLRGGGNSGKFQTFYIPSDIGETELYPYPFDHHTGDVELHFNPDTNRPITTSTFDDDIDGQIYCTIKCDEDYFLCNQSCECYPNSMKCEKDIYCEDPKYEHECVLYNANLTEAIKLKCENITGHIMCPNTFTCIADEWLCDGDDDCGDYSDETRCGSNLNCTHDQFECQNGLCIHNLWVCDGDNDCIDYSDETNCTKLSCTADEFKCRNGDCVSASFQCNGEFDCIDHTDEQDCGPKTPVCPEGEFRCKGTNGGVGGGPGCILNRFRCDGDNDCGDWSDEDGCISLSTTCAPKEFKCADGKCISLDWLCDMQKDCDKGEDEKNCENVDHIKKGCKNDEFKCSDGRCILKSWICDGVPDCKYFDDEIDCPVHCEIGQFTCELPKNYTKKGLCVNQKHVCDGYKDCPLGDDEIKCPFYETCEQNSTCAQLCTVLDSVKGCDCKVGYILQKNKQKCDDIDECQYSINPVCSQVCINTMGSYHCDCLDGYVLRPDLRTCKALGSGVNLLLANRNDIRQVSLNTNKYTSIVKGLHNVIAIDYHYKKGLLFWSDISTDVIKMSSINGSNIKDVIKWGLESPGGIAVDWIHDLLFWTDSETKRIEVSNFEGSLRSVVIADDLHKPRAIVVHPGEAALFWTDWGPNSKIEKSYMDGSNRIILAKDDIFWPNGLVIDYPANRIYWADAKHHVIESMKLDGQDRKKILSKHLPHPFALTLFEDVLFWTDWHTKTISSAHKITGNGFHSIHYTIHFPMDIHSYHESRQPLFPNHCAIDKIGLKGSCSHMCIPNKINRSCVCPIGLTLNDDRTTCTTVPDKLLLVTRRKDIRMKQIKKNNIDVDMVLPLDSLKSAVAVDWCSKTDLIYWTDVGRSAISRANLNGSNQESIIVTNLESPAGLAMDWVTDKLYWTDPGPKRIEVSSINGKQRTILIWKDLDKPRDIVVNPNDGTMFWSDWGTTPLIECAGMDGKNRKVIVKNDLLWPNGLAIDYINNRLYFADGGTRSIEFVNFDGNHRTKVLTAKDGLAHPFGLDVYDNSIYWIDWETHSLDMIDSNNVHKTILHNTTDLMDVRIFHRDRDRTDIHNPCAINNGNCTHICLLNNKGHACACPIGVLLQNDKKTCNNGSSKYIIMAHRIDIRQISLDVEYVIDVVLPLPYISNAMAIDVDILTGDIYWSDSFDDIIRKATPDGICDEIIISDDLDSVDGLIIDVVGRKLYWTDGGRHTIEVSEMNGSNRQILIWKDLESPRGLAIDYDDGFLFWTDWGTQAKIERSHMDGEKRLKIITARLGWPNCLTIYDKRIYWTDAQTKLIESCDYDGNLREIIMTNLLHPYGIAVTNNIIYWTDWKNKSLLSMINVKGASANQKIIKSNLDGLMDIKIIEKNKVLPKNVCANNNGNCSHLCLRNPEGYSCKCPIGINLRKDNNYTCDDLPDNYLLVALRSGISRISLDTAELFDFVLPIEGIHGAVVLDYHYNLSRIYYADVNTDIIRMVDMKNMSNTKNIISSGLNTTNGLAVDWISNNIYWSDSAFKVIEVSRLDGTSRKVILKDNVNDPRSIIIYPKRGLIFWSDWGKPPKIERAAMDGSNRKTIIESNLGFPTGLAIDFDTRRLYWADALGDSIEMSDFNGEHRTNVVSYPKHPFGVTIYGSNIYWTDWYNKTVYRSSKSGGTTDIVYNEVLRNTLRGALDIRSVSEKRQPNYKNPCAEDNGGCSHLCLFIGRTYVCACPDKNDHRVCKTVPHHPVAVVTDDSLYEYIDEIVPTNGFINNDEINESNSSFSSYITYATVIVSIILILVVTIMLALGLHTRYKKKDKRSRSGSCRSVITFTNPNYNVSSMNGFRSSETKCKFWNKNKSERTQVSQMMRMDHDYMEPCMAEVDILPSVSIHIRTSSPKTMQSSSKTMPLSITG